MKKNMVSNIYKETLHLIAEMANTHFTYNITKIVGMRRKKPNSIKSQNIRKMITIK